MRSATRMSTAAYWASWADALAMIDARTPGASALVMASLESGVAPQGGCLEELRRAASTLDSHGFLSRPTWAELREGKRPQPPQDRDVGEWSHGWQYYASSASEHHFRRGVVLPGSDRADRAHLRSHSGLHAGCVLGGAPTAREFAVSADVFRTVVLERLRLPLAIAEKRCEGCGELLDAWGWHRAACSCSGRLRTRAVPTERCLQRV